MTSRARLAGLLARASVLAEGSIVNYSGERSAKAGSRPPSGTSAPFWYEHLIAYSRARTEAQKHVVCDTFEQAIVDYGKTRKSPSAYKPEELRYWVVQSVKKSQELAIELNCTVQHIRKIRQDAGQHPNTGKKAA